MNKIDVFFDVEGFGVGRGQGNGESIDTYLELLPAGLLREGYEIGKIWATARVRRPDTLFPGALQTRLRKIFQKHNGIIAWTTGIADEALKSEVRKGIFENTLAPFVLLIANDHDFCPLVVELVETKRFVLVSGITVSKRLQRVASKVIPLADLCGIEAVTIPPPNPVNLNPFPLDELQMP